MTVVSSGVAVRRGGREGGGGVAIMAKYTVGLSCSLHIYFTSINFPVILLNALTTVAYYLFCMHIRQIQRNDKKITVNIIIALNIIVITILK